MLLASESGHWDPASSGLGFALLASPGGRGGGAARDAGSSAPEPQFLRCPLSGFAEDAIRQSAPAALLSAQSATGGMVDAGRAWATALCLAFLQRTREHYAVERGELPGETVTVFDRGAAFLAELARQHPALAAALPRVQAEADAQVRAWEAAHAAAAEAAQAWVQARGNAIARAGGWRAGRELLLSAFRHHGARFCYLSLDVFCSSSPVATWPRLDRADRVFVCSPSPLACHRDSRDVRTAARRRPAAAVALRVCLSYGLNGACDASCTHEPTLMRSGCTYPAVVAWRLTRQLLACSPAPQAMLACEVFAYWRRGHSCCADARAILGCSSDPTEPCRGFKGACADLVAQFAEFPESHLGDFECAAFPHSGAVGWHAAIVGLVMAAIALGVRKRSTLLLIYKATLRAETSQLFFGCSA